MLPDDDSAPQTDRFPGSEPAAANVSARIWWLRSRRARSLRALTTASLKLFRLVVGLAGDGRWRSAGEILEVIRELPAAPRRSKAAQVGWAGDAPPEEVDVVAGNEQRRCAPSLLQMMVSLRESFQNDPRSF